MNFELALHEIKLGHRVARQGWNGKGMWIEIQRPDEHSKMSLPYIYMSTATGHLVPWLASQTDILAEDWGAGDMSEAARKLEDDWTKVFGNALLIMAVLPETGDAGKFDCPACKMGTVFWSRAPSNKHVRFKCDGCETGLIQ